MGGRGSCRAGRDPDGLRRSRLGRSLALPPASPSHRAGARIPAGGALAWDRNAMCNPTGCLRPGRRAPTEETVMRYSDQIDNLRVLLDAHHCELSAGDVERLKADVVSFGRVVQHFPVADLHVLVDRNARRNEVSVKTTLILPGRTLVASDHAELVHTALETCVRNLFREVEAYKAELDQQPQRHKAAKVEQRELGPTVDPDPSALEAAVREGDYSA